MTPDDEPLAPGDVVAARWQILGPIGSGGHATVYLAEHCDLGHQVAIKVLHLDRCGNSVEEMVDRFKREARIAARVRHPNVVHVHDFGDLPDGSPYFVMELVLGEDLQARIDREGPLGPAAAVDVALQTLAGLDALAGRGIVHRDIKPGNLMLEPASGGATVKLVDFGIAGLEEPGRPKLTVDGTVLGTPEYMSPEQIRGLELDARSDVYSLGVVLYECLTGVLPLSGKGPCATLAMALTQPPPALRVRNPELPEALEAIVMKSLAKDREERWASPADMFLALEATARSLGLPRGPAAWSDKPVGFRPIRLPDAAPSGSRNVRDEEMVAQSGRRPAARARHRRRATPRNSKLRSAGTPMPPTAGAQRASTKLLSFLGVVLTVLAYLALVGTPAPKPETLDTLESSTAQGAERHAEGR